MSAVLGGVALGALAAPAAHAQAQAAPAAPQGEVHDFNIPAGPLGQAITTWSRQSGRSIVFRSEDMGSKRTKGVRGRMTDVQALNRLLAGTGFVRIEDASGAFALSTVPSVDTDAAGNATPDILVTGQRTWSLNTGIKRSQDDSQPFIVLTGEEIRRSGAPNLESYLRDQLSVNASPNIGEQANPRALTPGGALQPTRGLSNINLRGIGSRDTLILVDGRRQPGVNIGDGTLTQTSITGIPVAAIERIEVLASSASGIYGSGASGGVINIVLKRDFHGGEIAIDYNNTTDFSQGGAQIDLTYGMPLEGGRTKLSVTGGWRKSNPLLYGDRYFLAQDAQAKLIANDPDAFEGTSFLPYGNAVNYRNSRAAPLILKPQYGGTRLNSSFGTILPGYRGIPTDGLQGLLAGLGQFNTEQPDSATFQGKRSPLIYGSEVWNGSLTLRREFNNWLTGYIGGTGSLSKSVTNYARKPTDVFLRASSQFNPFTTSISVTLPGKGQDYRIFNDVRSGSLIGGAIVKLPYEWQAAIDLSYSATRFNSDIQPPFLSDETAQELSLGGQNVLRDLSITPLDLVYNDTPFGSARQPGPSSSFAPSLRIAGPLPLTLPGGKPRITFNAEYARYWIGASVSTFLNPRSISTYTPTATQDTWSGYGEIALPLVGPGNNIPLIREFELRFSARGEWYSGRGSDPINCSDSITPATMDNPFAGCPPEGIDPTYSTTKNSHVDPSISFRWLPVDGLMLRGSYTTGYLPPQLNQLVRTFNANAQIFNLSDPLRGDEPLPSELGVYSGGNPNVRPESSKSFSAGAVIAPEFLQGFRFSADFTSIKKRDVYFDPFQLIIPFFFGGNDAAVAAYKAFAAANPDRFVRGAPSGGYPVGIVTELDLSLVNLTSVTTQAIDFTFDYSHPLFGGTLDIGSRATHVLSLKVDSFPDQTAEEYAGVVTSGFAAAGGSGSLRWRGSGSARWTKGPLSFGWQMRYFDRYKLNVDGSIVAAQGSAYVASQLYNDFNLSYDFPFKATLTFGINNVFNKLPPLDSTAAPLYYSAYADPRLRNFHLGIRKSF